MIKGPAPRSVSPVGRGAGLSRPPLLGSGDPLGLVAPGVQGGVALDRPLDVRVGPGVAGRSRPSRERTVAGGSVD